MKKIIFAVVPLIMAITGCATTKTEGPSVLVVTREDSMWPGAVAWVSIDGKGKVKLKSGESRTFTIANGHHVIRGVREKYNNPGGAGGYFRASDDSLSFDSDNERIEIKFDPGFLASSTGRAGLGITRRITLSQPASTSPAAGTAINRSFNTLSQLIPDGAKIVIVGITPANADNVFIQEELMLLFVNSRKFNVVERQTLDAIRQEQRFQMSGEVSDETAVSVGHFLGADVVVLGTVTGNGQNRRLRLRAINVTTAQVMAMSSEDI
jgi:hypothetical protein